MLLPPATRLGPYEVLAPLGSGGVGEVYRARDTRLGREVAIRVMREGAAFYSKAIALCKLSHPNVAAVFDFGTEGDTDFLIMELVSGVSLAERLRKGPLPVADVLPLSLQLAEGIAAAHEIGIVHRNLEPGSIRVTPEGRLKVVDFGLTPAATPGTLAYMAPEMLGGARATTRSDVFALGVVMHEMATGGQPSALRPELLEGIDAVILAARHREPAERPATAGDVAASLRALVAELRRRVGIQPDF